MSTRTHTQTYKVATAFTGPQTPISMEAMIVSASTVAVVIVNGTATYGVEVTLDDVNDQTVVPEWFPLEGMPPGTTATKYVGFVEPFAFIRINLAALTGEVQFKLLQSFNEL